ncbi:MAG: cyclic nucleotide-binding domain-containing protein [Verrucomicrobia bacterium]|nr:cyclic nucleotide-binding domain-containing protein [Verrucomicrobiota bacterium]
MSEKPETQHATRVLAAARKVPVLSMMFRRLEPRQQEIVSLLRRTTIFADLTASELIELLHLLHERTFVAGETVFTEGEPGLGLYVVLKGEIEIGSVDKDGKGRVARLGHGEVFGEVSFLDGSGRSATATATIKTDLIGFYRTELFDLLERKPALASKILLALARQMGMRMRAMLQLIQP